MNYDERKAMGEANAKKAKASGLVLAYFPNGSAFDGFHSACCDCRHHIDDLNNPKPGRLTPPYVCCTWGVLDRIYEAMATGRYGYGQSAHPPEDMELWEGKFDPICRRFTRKDYGDDDRDPRKPDVPGQMLLGEDTAPVENGETVERAAR